MSGSGDDLAFRQRRILWFAMLSSLVIYAVVAFVVVGKVGGAPAAAGLPPWLFPVVAGAIALTALLLHPRLAGSESPRREAAPMVPVGELVVWTLDESVAVIGLVATFLTETAQFYVAYAVVAAFLLWAHRPRP